MKAKVYFLLAFIFIIKYSSAQNNFAPVGATWFHSGQYGIYKTAVSEETVLKGMTCKKLTQNIYVKWPAPDYYRDLESSRDLFVYDNGDTIFCYNNRFDQFTPLFVFNVNAGDTVRLPYFNPSSHCTMISAFDSTMFAFVVDSVKNVNYDGKLLKTVFSKVLRSKKIYDNSDFGWVRYNDSVNIYAEKIGSLKTGFLPNCLGKCLTLATTGCAAPLGFRCYEDDTLKIHLIDSCLDPTWVPSSIHKKDISSLILKLYPNPVGNDLFIQNPNQSSNTKLKVYDILGINIYEQSNKTGSIINYNTSNLKSGLYYIKLYDLDNSPIGSAKFLKQ
jgi:hypothetical protein